MKIENQISIMQTYLVAKRSAQEIEQSNDDVITKHGRMAGIAKFLLEMLEKDLEVK